MNNHKTCTCSRVRVQSHKMHVSPLCSFQVRNNRIPSLYLFTYVVGSTPSPSPPPPPPSSSEVPEYSCSCSRFIVAYIFNRLNNLHGFYPSLLLSTDFSDENDSPFGWPRLFLEETSWEWLHFKKGPYNFWPLKLRNEIPGGMKREKRHVQKNMLQKRVKLIIKQFKKVRKTRHQRISRETKSGKTEPIAFS